MARAFELIERGAQLCQPFDVVHDHSGFVACAMADRLRVPLVHTAHGQMSSEAAAFYARHARKVTWVAISRSQRSQAPAALQGARVIPNPISVERWPFRAQKDAYVLWIGRVTEEKGPHLAIEAARRANVPLVLAGPVQPGKEGFFASEVAPRLDGEAVRYVGEVGGAAKAALFAGARAMLMPIRWPEPFGMVMVEALACGTPVIAYPEGAAGEIVVHGETGLLVADQEQMASAIGRIHEIDSRRCRDVVAARFNVDLVAGAYERAYFEAVERRGPRPPGGYTLRRLGARSGGSSSQPATYPAPPASLASPVPHGSATTADEPGR